MSENLVLSIEKYEWSERAGPRSWMNLMRAGTFHPPLGINLYVLITSVGAPRVAYKRLVQRS